MDRGAGKNRRIRLYIIAAAVLLLGCSASVFIYLTAGDDLETGSYAIIDGKAYPLRIENTKTYRHDMELYGGKWNLVADDFRRWFTDLWKGRRLAYTVAAITFTTSLVFFIAGRNKRAS